MSDLYHIAHNIASDSDGAWNIAWSDEFLELEGPEQRKVTHLVYEQIDACDSCGWYWNKESLEYSANWEGGLCYQCLDYHVEEEE